MLAAVAVVIVTVGVTMLLLAIASGAKPGTDRANSRLDAVRTGLAAGAAVGAAAGLFLAFRRQHHQEVVTKSSDHDAIERRITELYTKAVEQLGNDKAPVRLGGLYALERLAQDNPAQRETIVNVICAYLRMPFSPTSPNTKAQPVAVEDEEEPEIGDSWQQERQVRLTAQRILADHLRDDRAKDKRSTDPPSPRFWPGIHLDLAGATLINFGLEDCVMAGADFSGATFDFAGFSRATFNGNAMFLRATFNHRGGWFSGATFNGAYFSGATFNGEARFGGATFDFAGFLKATFNGSARFDAATFSDLAYFKGATFSGGEGSLSLKGSRVLSPDAQHSWPAGWCLGPDGSGGYTVVRADDAGRS